jgi:hypothetical protein
VSQGKNQISDFPPLRKGALVVLETTTNNIKDTIYFQFNPEKLTRNLQIQSSGKEGGDRTEALRLKGPPIETIDFVAIFDALSSQSSPAEQDEALRVGIYPQLSALEGLLYPTSQQVKTTMQDAAKGVLEIVPPQAPVTLFVWGAQRVLPVRLANFSISEQAYDVNLNPIRAEVTMSLRVLSYNDLPWDQRESRLFLAHHEGKEQLAQRRPRGYSATTTGVETGQFFR